MREIAGSLTIIAAVGALWIWLLELAWNYLVPLFNGPTLTYWQTFAAAFIIRSFVTRGTKT